MGDATQQAVREQARLYGSPIGDQVARARATLGLNQGQVAQVLGLSAPMLSQLVGGHRVKIGNPVVADRLDQLAELGDDVEGGLDPALVPGRLERIRDSETTARTRRVTPPPSWRHALREAASEADLRRAAALLDVELPALASLLREGLDPD